MDAGVWDDGDGFGPFDEEVGNHFALAKGGRRGRVGACKGGVRDGRRKKNQDRRGTCEQFGRGGMGTAGCRRAVFL